MNHLLEVQAWLRRSHVAGLVIPTTDEFLSEFAPPANRRLRWVTGFRGSTGLAIVLREGAALFLDGRYRLQAAADIGDSMIAIEPATAAARSAWLRRSLVTKAPIGIDPWLHSAPDMAQWRSLAGEIGFELELLRENPIDRLWGDARPLAHRPLLLDYAIGEAYEVKRDRLAAHIRAAGLQALLLADPEDVSWLLNVRASDESLRTQVDEWHIVPSCTSRALVRKDGKVSWFVDGDRLAPNVLERGRELIAIEPPDRLAAALADITQHGAIGADPHRTPAALMAMIEEGKARPDDTVARCRWRKHAIEINSARQVHRVDAVAVVRFMEWLTLTIPERTVSEIEAAEKLAAMRAEHPDYKGPSEPFISASGPSGAQPHYVPSRHACRRLEDHPIYLMDSGGQYIGGTTDNTFTLVLGTPEAKHVLAHTLVLKGYIALASARFPVGTPAFRLDTIARQALWREGMDYATGTGHGVGNYMNIHEGPVIRPEPWPISMVALEPGMIVTNEPGYYASGDFGIRIESHMVVVASPQPNFLEFETISRLPIDPRLIDFARLSSAEFRWLNTYHRTVLHDLEPLLDVSCAAWLRAFVQPFLESSEKLQCGFRENLEGSRASAPPTATIDVM